MTDPRERYVERMGTALSDAGLQRLPSRVFAALTVDEDGRMTSAELVDTLGVSPASVSGAVRDVYVVDDDAWLQATMRGDQAYAPMVAALDDALRRIDTGTHAHRRLFLMREFLVFVGAEMAGVAVRWRAHRAELERGLG